MSLICLNSDDTRPINDRFSIAACTNYLCLNTLACVDKPTHCPCVFPAHEIKFEIDQDGLAICLSKSGENVGSLTTRKVELARKGLL